MDGIFFDAESLSLRGAQRDLVGGFCPPISRMHTNLRERFGPGSGDFFVNHRLRRFTQIVGSVDGCAGFGICGNLRNLWLEFSG